MQKEYLWRSLDHPGFEHVRVDESHPGWTVFDSMIVREHDDGVTRAGYTLIVDKAFRTLEIRIMAEQEPGSMAALHLLASGDGTWTDGDERRIPSLDGVIDVDIPWTPLTNTLPIQRLGQDPGTEDAVAVAYIDVPSLSLSRASQRYTRIDHRTVRYHSEERDTARHLLLDTDGFVLEYPDLFSREWPRQDD